MHSTPNSGPPYEVVEPELPGYEFVRRREALKPLAEGLSSTERRVMRMRYLDGRTEREIADRTGLAPAQVARVLERLSH